METLTEAIEREGSSFDVFYRTPEGQPGSFQHQFQVYGRDGEPCKVCGRGVARIAARRYDLFRALLVRRVRRQLRAAQPPTV